MFFFVACALLIYHLSRLRVHEVLSVRPLGLLRTMNNVCHNCLNEFQMCLFWTKSEDELRGTIKRFLPNVRIIPEKTISVSFTYYIFISQLSQENGCGVLCILYSLLLSRNFNRFLSVKMFKYNGHY